MNKDNLFLISGYFLLTLWIISTLVSFYRKEFSSILWFCNISVIVIALACLKKSNQILEFFLAIGIFFQTPWILDWILTIFFDFSIFRLSEFYAGAPLYFMVLTFIRHTLTIPLVIFLMFFIKPSAVEKKILILLISAIIFVMILSYYLPESHNINCAHKFCSGNYQFLSGKLYFFGWLGFIIILSLISFFYIIRPLHKVMYKFYNRLNIN